MLCFPKMVVITDSHIFWTKIYWRCCFFLWHIVSVYIREGGCHKTGFFLINDHGYIARIMYIYPSCYLCDICWKVLSDSQLRMWILWKMSPTSSQLQGPVHYWGNSVENNEGVSAVLNQIRCMKKWEMSRSLDWCSGGSKEQNRFT